MNLKELMAKRAELLGTVKTVIGEANAALADNNLDRAAELQEKVSGYQKQVEMYSTQIKSLQAADAAEGEFDEPADEPVVETPVTKTAARLPFEEQPEEEPKDPVAEAVKSIYITKFGDDTEKATGAIIKDLYGKDYMQKRMDQQDAFVKYVRTGKMDDKEERLLKTLIYRPQEMEQNIKEGMDYKSVKATIQESTGELGGYLVPEDYRAQMIKRIADTGIIRRYARKVSTNRDAIEWPVLLGGDDRYTSAVRVTWIDENPSNASGALTNPTFGMQRIPVHTTMARVDLSRNQLEDSAFNMIEMMTTLFGEAAGIDEDIQFLTGEGGNTPRGVLGLRNGNQASPLAGVETVNTGGSSSMQSDGLFDLVYDLPQQYRGNAILVGSRTTHRDVRKLKDNENRYLWETSLKVGEPPTLLGYPIFESESVPAVAANSYPLIFGDWSGYVIADRVGMTFERVTDATTVGQNKVALFMRRRLGGDVVEPWKFKVQKVAS